MLRVINFFSSGAKHPEILKSWSYIGAATGYVGSAAYLHFINKPALDRIKMHDDPDKDLMLNCFPFSFEVLSTTIGGTVMGYYLGSAFSILNPYSSVATLIMIGGIKLACRK